MLVAAGHRVVALEELTGQRANVDLLVDGQLWEVKDISDAEDSVKRQVRKGRRKWYRAGMSHSDARLVMTSVDAIRSEESVIADLRYHLGDTAEMIYITRDGRIVPISE